MLLLLLLNWWPNKSQSLRPSTKSPTTLALPVIDDGEKDAHEHVEVDDEEDDEEEGEPPLVVVRGHHDVWAVGRRNQDEQVPEGVEEVVEVGLAPDLGKFLVLEKQTQIGRNC